nr:histidine kinase [Modestobacter marinus]
MPGSDAIGVQLGELSARGLDAVGVLLVLAQCLPLVVRRSSPASCLAVVVAAFSLHQLAGYPATPAGLGLYVALYSAGAHLRSHRWTAAAAATAAYALLACALQISGSPESLLSLTTFYPVLVVAWGAGAWMRSRVQQEAARRRSEAQQAVIAERVRIAHELHDVVTHHVTAMVVQADAAQYLLDVEPTRTATSLATISETGRAAMTDLRHLLGVLNSSPDTGAPVPDADRSPAVHTVSELVDRARAAGQQVELVENGAPQQLAAGVRLATYRVVQEGLTNALKHAAGAPVLVRVDHRPDAVDVQVSTGTPDAAERDVPLQEDLWPSSGRGLTGLRERVGVLGGQLAAGPGPGGGFTVRAHIPAGEAR